MFRRAWLLALLLLTCSTASARAGLIITIPTSFSLAKDTTFDFKVYIKSDSPTTPPTPQDIILYSLEFAITPATGGLQFVAADDQPDYRDDTGYVFPGPTAPLNFEISGTNNEKLMVGHSASDNVPVALEVLLARIRIDSTGAKAGDVFTISLADLSTQTNPTATYFALLGPEGNSDIGNVTFSEGRVSFDVLITDSEFAAVPEPSSMLLCGIGGFLMLSRRLRRGGRAEKPVSTVEQASI